MLWVGHWSIDDDDEDLGNDGEAANEASKMEELEKWRILRHFGFFKGFFFEALDGTQFLLCVVEGREVTLTPGV